MVSARARAWIALWSTMCACAFDSGGGMGGASAEIGQLSTEEGGDDGDDNDADDANAETSADPDDTSATDPEDEGEAGEADASGTTSGGQTDGPAVLSFVEAPAYDFTLVPLGTTQPHVVTLHNTGGTTATALTATIDSPFRFAGEAWPGTGGTCLDMLAPDGFCQLEIAFEPATLGPTGGKILVEYDSGEAPAQAVLSLAGAGSGLTTNLLQNGDGETIGTPPPGWVATTGGGWTATTEYARSGAASITPGASPNGEVVLRQPVDVSQWAALVDADMLSIAFAGWSRTYADGNDDHFFRVDFVNAEGDALQTFQGAQRTSPAWTQTMDQRVAPAGTRAVVVRLHCSKNTGTYCDGFFDDISVVAGYPAR